MEQPSEFLLARLAAAKAIPPERRSVDVAAFVEYIQLHQEVLEAMRKPGAKWSTVNLLKVARAENICLGDLLQYSRELQQMVAGSLLGLLRGNGTPVGTLGQQILAVLKEGSPLLGTLGTWALVMAGMGLLSTIPEAPGLLSMGNEVVVLLQQPSLRQRLTRELAAEQKHLSRQLLTYEQLLAFFVNDAVAQASNMLLAAGGKMPVNRTVLTAALAGVALLPKLAPDSPRLLWCAGGAAALVQGAPGVPTVYLMMRDAQRVAEAQCSEYYVALESYKMVPGYIASSATTDPAELDTPSTVLGWLAAAEAAHGRCKGVLPKHVDQARPPKGPGSGRKALAGAAAVGGRPLAPRRQPRTDST